MKKISFLLLSVLMIFAACTKEDVNIGSKSDEMFTVKLATETGVQTRAESPTVPDGYKLRYILEVYHVDDLVNVFYRGEQFNPTFNFRLVTSQKYNFVAWVDYVPFISNDAKTDLHYNTGSLKAISMTEDYLNNDPSRDAFFGKALGQEMGVIATPFIDIPCKRPFGQLNITTTDWEDASRVVALTPAGVQIEFAANTTFNAVDDKISDIKTISYTSTDGLAGAVSVDGKSRKLTCDYIFASSSEEYLVSPDLIFYNASGIEITDTKGMMKYLPIQRNYRTNVTGMLLTKKGSVTVKVDAEWGDVIDHTIELDKLQDLLDNLTANSPEVVYISVVGEGALAPNGSGYYNFTLPQTIGGDNVNTKHIHINFIDGISDRHDIGMKYAVPSVPYQGKITFESKVYSEGGINYALGGSDVHFKGSWNSVGPRATQKLTVEKGATIKWINAQGGDPLLTPTWLINCYGTINKASMLNNTTGTPWTMQINKDTDAEVNNSIQDNANGVITITNM